MSLNTALEGYEYQDLLSAYFILREILIDNDSTFIIDVKEYESDKFDDLTIINQTRTFKKQIKYSNLQTSHTLEKKDLADSSHDLAIDVLFNSWLQIPDKQKCEVRLCLAWDEPIDELRKILYEVNEIQYSFNPVITKTYKINSEILWPNNEEPLSSWRRFKKKSKEINKEEFKTFCDSLIIECNFPKFTLLLSKPGKLEEIVMNQLRKIGIGIYPNEQLTIENCLLKLIQYIKYKKVNGQTLTIFEILNYLQIRRDYGSIEQIFPIDENKNIINKTNIEDFLGKLITFGKIILWGEPGSGKSWFIQNFQKHLEDKQIKYIKHYCYTDLQDEYQIDRITTNVFYANLISDILKVFPELKSEKQYIYASSLNELNLLLEKINENIIVIVDGLDHIQRIFEMHNAELTQNETKIINSINQLTLNDNVRILIVSQKISELNDFQDYEQIEIPSFSDIEIKELMEKTGVKEVFFENGNILSDLFLVKSNGNPLYLSYLLEEFKNQDITESSAIDNLPEYNYNLTLYYDFLLGKINVSSEIPRLLSGIDFSLTTDELKEITGLGEIVIQSLELLSPILKYNYSTRGFLVYHESFRRYIIEKLKLESISIYDAIYRHIINWMKLKGFFKFQKSFRYLIQLLFENDKHEEILEYLCNEEYLIESFYYGNTWNSMKKNYKYFVKTALFKKDFPIVIKLTEINKILSSTENEFEDSFENYLSAFGYLNGFEKVVEYLSFDGRKSIDDKNGIKACYICSENGAYPPWYLYVDYFGDSGIVLEDFKYYVQYQISEKQIVKLSEMASKLISKNWYEYAIIFKTEIEKIKDDHYKNFLLSDANINLIIHQSTYKNIDKNIYDLANELLTVEFFSKDNIHIVVDFFNEIEEVVSKGEFDKVNSLKDLFTDKNWFYNWIIFFMKIKLLKQTSNFNLELLIDAFRYLKYDTNPFKGNPRTCDLYSLEEYIYNSIKEGVSLINNNNGWLEILDILDTVQKDTTTYLQRSAGGPLSINKFFKLLFEITNEDNIDLIIEYYKKTIDEEEFYSLYSYLADYHFRFSIIYSLNNDHENSNNMFRKGIMFILSYTFRKDTTIEELTDSIESICKIDYDFGLKYILKIRNLVYAVVYHTDGKGTNHFPIEWFDKFSTVNLKLSILYLSNRLLTEGYHWRFEESLQVLLIKLNCSIDPVIESFIYKTLVAVNTETFINYGIQLYKKLEVFDSRLAEILKHNVINRLSTKSDNRYSPDFLNQLNKIKDESNIHFVIENNKADTVQYTSHYNNNSINLQNIQFNNRKMFSEMNSDEIYNYFEDNDISETDLIALKYYFETNTILSDKLKKLIKILTLKGGSPSRSLYDGLDYFFNNASKISIYYWVCKYVNDVGSWYEKFVNIKAFEKAYTLNQELALDFLMELLEGLLLNFDYKRTISANLIINLTGIGIDENIIKQMWENLYGTIDSRLPSKEEFDWSEILENENNLTLQEILCCILITRLNINTTDRHNYASCGIHYLLYNNPQLLVKPLKWFFKNRSYFLELSLLVVLQLIFDYNNYDDKFIDNFNIELNELYPTNYFLIDYMLEKLLNKSSRLKLIEPGIIYNISDKEKRNFLDLNLRNRLLDYYGFDVKNIFGKFLQNSYENFGKKVELFSNGIHRKQVKNLYPSNYLLKLINEDLYNDFRESTSIPQDEIYNNIKINYYAQIAQNNSLTIRPQNIQKPHSMMIDFSRLSHFESHDNWIRIAYYELEFEEENSSSDIKEIRIFGGLVFNENLNNEIPYYKYCLNINDLWNNNNYKYVMNEFVIMPFFQFFDSFEWYKILWLNPIICNILNIKVSDIANGLMGLNENGEIVLKFNRWFADYFGTERIDEEIPKLDGAQLLIREDYFMKLCELFSTKAYYYIYKIS